MKNPSLFYGVVLLIVVLLLPACSGPEGGGLILIVMDTVRADHLSLYGYERPTSRQIDAFAEGATVYKRAIASASWTVPSHASLFTGKDPYEHGAHRLDPTGSDQFDNINALHDGQTTLAEVLSQEGYSTTAIVANETYLSPRWKLDQGFRIYDTWYTTGDSLNTKVFDWVDTLSMDNFFLFVNYMDAHDPYNTREVDSVVTDIPVAKDPRLRGILAQTTYRGKVHQGLQRRVIAQYDTGIANDDAAVGALLQRLKDKGIYDDATIIITSDHGETFGSHQLMGHGKDVWEGTLWVPLIIKRPGQKKQEVEPEPISLSDIPRMVLDFLPGGLEKRYADTFPHVRGSHPIVAENYFASPHHTQRYGPRLKRVRTAYFDWPYKYIRSSVGLDNLFDVEKDPTEQNDLIAVEHEIAKELGRRLEAYQESLTPGTEMVDQPPLTDAEIRRLKALGYID